MSNNAYYPNGVIPVEELIFPQTVAQYRDGIFIIDGDLEVQTVPTNDWDTPMFSSVYALSNGYGDYSAYIGIYDPDRYLPISVHNPAIWCIRLDGHKRVLCCRNEDGNYLYASDEDFSGFSNAKAVTGI